MSHVPTAPTAPAAGVPTAAYLRGRLYSLGWEPGYPATVTEATKATDARTCRRLLCPGCGRPGMTPHPYHLGTRFRIVAACPACEAGEEV